MRVQQFQFRAKFTVHECDPSPRYQNVLQYVVKFFDEEKEFDKVYSMDSFTEMEQITRERPETVQANVERINHPALVHQHFST